MVEQSQARQRFGARVRAIRHARKLTLKRLGASLGKTETSMSRIELGKQNLTLDDITRLADLLGVTPADFFQHDSLWDETQYSGLEYFKLRPVFPYALARVSA